jgi:hypothetical protein
MRFLLRSPVYHYIYMLLSTLYIKVVKLSNLIWPNHCFDPQYAALRADTMKEVRDATEKAFITA